MNNIIIGIDLGTTNSEVALIQNGKTEIIEIDGCRLLPSVVGLSEQGELLVGQKAHNQFILYPDRTIKSIKRKMGSQETVTLGDETYTPQEISAMILRYLKQAAEAYVECPISQAVITVPAYFSDTQRQATKDAGELAGLEVLRIINEPTAAALAYEANHNNQKHILVYDLGGGTFDVSVVRKQQDIVEVLASHGNNHLGGDDFDTAIVNHILDHLVSEKAINAENHPAAMARIQRAAENAKIKLSNAPYTQINEEFLLKLDDGLPVHLTMELGRHHYEDMIEPMLQETLESVHIAIKDAGLTVSDIDEILLAGGATRTPLIQSKLESILNLQPRFEIDPDLCVAKGAAIQAAVIAGHSVSSVLVDVTPYSFGTSALGDFNGMQYPFVYVPLIRKNSPIPISNSDVFTTSYDGQTAINVTVFQGEDPDAMNNTSLGSFMVENLTDTAAGNKIIIKFALDINGILKVTAKEKETGLEKHITIDNAVAKYDVEEMDEAKSRINLLMGGIDNPNNDNNQAGHLTTINKAEQLMQTVGDEDRDDLIDAIEDLKDAINQDDNGIIAQHKASLDDLIYYLDN